MKRLHIGLVAVSLGTLSGCSQGTTGGPGASNTPGKPASSTAQKTVLGQADETFNLSVPSMSTSLKQGETKDALISLTRGKNFDEDVTPKFDDVPKGITIDPTNPVIKHGDKDVKLSFQVADDAALGNFAFKVTGHPTKGAEAKTEFSLTVAKK